MSFWSHQSPVFAWKNQVNTSSQVRWLDDVFSGCLPPQKKSPSNIQIISMKKKCHTYLIFSGLPPSPSQKKVALGSACAWKCRLAFLTSLKMVSLVLETNKHRQPKKRNLSQQVKTNSPQTESGSIFGGESRPNKSWLKKKMPHQSFKAKLQKCPHPQPTLKLKLGHFLLHFPNFPGCFFRWANQATPFRSTSAGFVVVGRSLQSVLHVVYPTLERDGCQFVKDVSHNGGTCP